MDVYSLPTLKRAAIKIPNIAEFEQVLNFKQLLMKKTKMMPDFDFQRVILRKNLPVKIILTCRVSNQSLGSTTSLVTPSLKKKITPSPPSLKKREKEN